MRGGIASVESELYTGPNSSHQPRAGDLKRCQMLQFDLPNPQKTSLHFLKISGGAVVRAASRLLPVLIAASLFPIAAVDSLAQPLQNLPPIKTVFIIMEENHNWSDITPSAAPYIQKTLVPMGAHAEQYHNPPGNHPSEPNYVWLEAGSNLGITNDLDPNVNHQSTVDHLVSYLNKAGISWKTYQEDIDGTSCPLVSVGNYAAKHNPFIFFHDVTGNDSLTSAYCISHVRPYGELTNDLENNTVARYNFITPNLCHDMHDCSVTDGDSWLSSEVPKILASQAYKDGGALFITWDESEGSPGDGPIGMVVLSPFAKTNYFNSIHYTHSSTLKTFEEIFGVTPLLRDAATATDLSDLFIAALPRVSAIVKNSASYSSVALASDMIAFGDAPNIAAGLAVAPEGPLPTTLGGVRLDITDSAGQIRSAPLYYVTTNAMAYLIPDGLALGLASVKLTTSMGSNVAETLMIDRVAPGLYTANSTGSGVAAGFFIHVAADGAQSAGFLFDLPSRNPLPVDLGPAGDQVFLSLYGTGFRRATQATAKVGGVSVPVYGFAAVDPDQGEDVINIGPLPPSLAGHGVVDILTMFDGKPANIVTASIN
jgi:uncharacterized protein (TIGR03437 family)